jgi:hypothetical protein
LLLAFLDWLAARLPFNLDRKDSAFIVGSFVVMTLSATLLFFHLSVNLDEGGEKIGEISSFSSSVQRKPVSMAVWVPVDTGMSVSNRDSLRTGDTSDAIVTLKDGTRIEVGEKSMIVLALSSSSAEIKFVRGTLRVKSDEDEKGEKKDSSIKIKAGDREIEASSSDLSLASNEEGKLDVILKKGIAKIFSGDKETEIKQDEQATLDQKAGEIIIKKLDLRLNAPGDGYRVAAQGGKAPVGFGWQAVDSAVTFELARDRGFGDVVSRQVVKGTGSSANLGPGIYYWRVRGKNSDGTEAYSPVYNVTVLSGIEVQLYGPVNGTEFDYTDREADVQFSWNSSGPVKNYQLQIASNAGFSGASSFNTRSTGYSARLGEGNYYWRVTATSQLDDSQITSDTRNFRISKLTRAEPPVLAAPANNAEILDVMARQRGLSFQWLSKGSRNCLLEVSSSPGMGSPLISQTASGNFATVKRDFAPGRYFWRVTIPDEKAGNVSSAVGSFRITQPEAVRLSNPGQGEKFSLAAMSGGARFSWQGPSGASYRLRIARDPGMGSIRLERNLAGTAYSVSGLEAGDYFWQVSLFVEGEKLSDSEIGRFSVIRELSAPVLGFPARGLNVNMDNLDALTFRWDAVPGASGYRLQLFRRGRVLDIRTRENIFVLRDLTKLDVGDFTWQVEALEQDGKAGPAARGNFSISLSESKPPEELDLPEKIFIE